MLVRQYPQPEIHNQSNATDTLPPDAVILPPRTEQPQATPVSPLRYVLILKRQVVTVHFPSHHQDRGNGCYSCPLDLQGHSQLAFRLGFTMSELKRAYRKEC